MGLSYQLCEIPIPVRYIVHAKTVRAPQCQVEHHASARMFGDAILLSKVMGEQTHEQGLIFGILFQACAVFRHACFICVQRISVVPVVCRACVCGSIRENRYRTLRRDRKLPGIILAIKDVLPNGHCGLLPLSYLFCPRGRDYRAKPPINIRMTVKEQPVLDSWGSIYHVGRIQDALDMGPDYWKTQMYTRRLVILRTAETDRALFWKWCGMFGRQFGLPQYRRMREHVEPINVDGQIEFIGILSLVTSKRLGGRALYWHADNPDVGLPMRALCMASCEDLTDGALSWLNIEHAWQQLDENTRNTWRTRKVELQSWYEKGTGFQIYPAVKQHPVTGVEGPFANDYCLAGTSRDDRWVHDVLDANDQRLGGAEMRDLLEAMEATQDAIYTHYWQLGDIAIYDNQAFLHGRPALRMGPQGDRVMWRCNVDHDTAWRLPRPTAG